MAMKSDLLLLQKAKSNDDFFLSIPVSDDPVMRGWHVFSTTKAAIEYGIAELKRLVGDTEIDEEIAEKQALITELEKTLANERSGLRGLENTKNLTKGKLDQEDIDEILLKMHLLEDGLIDKDGYWARRYNKLPVLLTASKVIDEDKDGDLDIQVTYAWNRYKI